jgi:hypothetical protein
MMDESIPKEDQLAEVSAHSNPRPTHATWQGGVYKVYGSNEQYENLVDVTDLGDVCGLCGISCHHSYYTFIEGASTRTYSNEQLEEMKRKAIEKKEYSGNGKSYTGYEATQYQRQIENEIRKAKRENLIYKETGLDAELKANNAKIKQLRSEYKSFSLEMGIPTRNNRMQI